MSAITINLTPTPNVFYAEHNRNIGFLMNVKLTISAKNRCVSITDDGDGCDDLRLLTSQGARKQLRGTESGMYGVGVKAAALYFWGTYDIQTRHNGLESRASIVWDEVLVAGNFLSSGTCDPTNLPNGTELTFSDIREPKKVPSAERIKRDLLEWFWPAILDGRRLTLVIDDAKIDLKPKGEPKWVERIELGGTVNGKTWKGYAGIVPAENYHPGFTLVKAHRVVTHKFNDVLAGANAPQFYGVVFLDKSWQLSTLKDDLVDDDNRDALTVQLAEQCDLLLKKARLAGRSEFYEGISDELSEDLLNSKRYREPPKNKTGGIPPGSTGLKRKAKAKPDSDGPNPGKQKGAVIDVCPWHGNGELGKVEASNPKRGTRKHYTVFINTARNDVAEAEKRQDRTAIKLLVASLLSGYVAFSESEGDARQLLLEGVDCHSRVDTFYTIFGRWFPAASGAAQKAL